MLSVILLKVAMLRGILLNVIVPTVVMLSAVILKADMLGGVIISVIRLSVIMLNVVAPPNVHSPANTTSPWATNIKKLYGIVAAFSNKVEGQYSKIITHL